MAVGDLAEEETIRSSKSTVSRRCRRLAEGELLKPLGNGVYMITELGEAYLDEEYDAENEVFLKTVDDQNGPTASEDGTSET